MQIVIDILEETYEIAKQDLWKWPADDVIRQLKTECYYLKDMVG